MDDERPLLPRIYTTILVAEIAFLGALVAMFHRHPPRSYELGWVGAGSMIVMQLYSLRRRVRALQRLGPLRAWLDLHVFLGFQGFVLVAYHSVGISVNANLAAVNFALVAVVVLTGVVGRYLYSFIPRARSGDALAYSELAAALGPVALPDELRRECRGLGDLVALDVARRRALHEIARDRSISPPHARGLRRAVTLASRISGLEVAERWFSRWSLLHRPLSVLLLGITVLHVLAHFAYAT